MSGRRVSVIAPCRNERDHVAAFCDALAQQQLPQGVELEVLVADGMSDDGTRELLAQRCAADARFVMVDNPKRIVSSGLNRCLERAQGEVIVRMDLHTRYESDYIAECLAALARTRAANVGGPWRAEGEGATQEAIAAAFQSRWVTGGARSRDLGYEGPADTVYLGCWPRATFDQFGPFDESLVRNQDDEHNLRLTRGGAVVWQSARIVSAYRPRETLAQLFRQQLQYGYWKPFVMRKHRQAAALRQLVPGAFIAAMGLLAVLGLVWPAAGAGFTLLGQLYGLYVVVASLVVAQEEGFDLLLYVPLVIVTYHAGYGLGTLRGWLDVLRHRPPSPAYGGLTR
ncbi:glycosyltransferase family 2 protein [Methylibium sp.]|uniref:glycosyltransferase family 2 protein n=1 Tax=Methylibium sp. TaxID=2067992 RepID=UPI003D13465E